ncbi:hypothetical protein ADICEAN_00264 [Cesiribacter andamanensis AMV16]|uniref:Fibronectin type-III domain-containing protein n=2 Tax=Cesiribacter TaxID=1133570 RepID=M7NBU6_9BACT|nr:hypothetical protein ADICEAN_00264 [Cesiribacter andamanensis AMV16]
MSAGNNSSWSLRAKSGANSTGYTVTNLVAGQTYYFRMRIKNSSGKYSDYSNEAKLVMVQGNTSTSTTTTTSSTSSSSDFGAPGSLSGYSDKNVAAKLSWKDNSTTETEFEIYMSTGSTSNYSLRAKTGANSTAYTVSKLSSGQTYYFKIRAKNSSGKYTAFSNEIAVKMVTDYTSSRANTGDADGGTYYTDVTSGEEVAQDQTLEPLTTGYSLYPNPASSYLDISLADAQEGTTTLQLVDLSGRVRMERSLEAGAGSTYRLDLEDQQLTSGMYVLRISAGNSTKSLKFLKK